uniref:Uncharacterized protein n=1 Tax=Candidatus Kentrum sp. TUN TaxID=2126343 RepID=A0A450ZN22_9GAMM|nr:MAG: hypothetical protein BECKTUN1418D_GA0071000_10291 [Candidatus Kentron sp. TUN]
MLTFRAKVERGRLWFAYWISQNFSLAKLPTQTSSEATPQYFSDKYANPTVLRHCPLNLAPKSAVRVSLGW